MACQYLFGSREQALQLLAAPGHGRREKGFIGGFGALELVGWHGCSKSLIRKLTQAGEHKAGGLCYVLCGQDLTPLCFDHQASRQVQPAPEGGNFAAFGNANPAKIHLPGAQADAHALPVFFSHGQRHLQGTRQVIFVRRWCAKKYQAVSAFIAEIQAIEITGASFYLVQDLAGKIVQLG